MFIEDGKIHFRVTLLLSEFTSYYNIFSVLVGMLCRANNAAWRATSQRGAARQEKNGKARGEGGPYTEDGPGERH